MNIPPGRLLFVLLLLALATVAVRSASLQAATARNGGVLAFNQSVAVPDSTRALAATSRLEQAAALDPAHHSTLRLLGYAYLAERDEDAAVAAWRRVGGMGPELVERGAAAQEVGATTEALRWYERAIATEPQLPDSYLRAGGILEGQEAWPAAARMYGAGVAAGGAASANSDLQFRLANALSRLPEPVAWVDALSAAEQAAALDNFESAYNAVQTHYVMGLALLALERPRDAQSAFAQVVARRPDDYWSTVQLGRLALALDGDAARAEQQFESAITLDPTNRAAYRDLAEMQAERGQLQAAIATYERLLAQHPDDTSVRERLDALRLDS